MTFKGRYMVLPDGSPEAAELTKRGLIEFPLPNYGMRMYICPQDLEAIRDRVALAFEISGRVISAGETLLGRMRWRDRFEAAEIMETGERVVLVDRQTLIPTIHDLREFKEDAGERSRELSK